MMPGFADVYGQELSAPNTVCLSVCAAISDVYLSRPVCIWSRVEQEGGSAVCSPLVWPVYVWKGEASDDVEAGQRGHSGSVRASTLNKPCWNASHNITA